jgi:PKD domain
MSARFRILGASTAALAASLVGLSLSADVIVPSSAYSSGRNNAEFHSDVRVFNPTTSPVNFTPIFYGSNANGNVVNTVQMSVVTIGPRQQLSYDNVLQSLFGQPIGVFGPIRFRSSGTLLVSSGVNNVNGCGNGSKSGQGLPGIDVGQALKAGTLIQLAASADPATGYRSNLDFMNPGTTTANVTVTIRRGDGTHLSNGTLSVDPNGLVQKAIDDGGAFPGVAGTTDTNLWVEFTSDQPILVFASVINNGSGDPYAIAMTAEPSPPAAAPVASYTVSANAVAGQPVTFTDTSTNSPVSRLWAFGDGTFNPPSSSVVQRADTSAGKYDSALATGPSVVQHTYTSAGTYHSALFVVNAAGLSTFFADIVVAISPPTSTGSMSFKFDGVAVDITFTTATLANVNGTGFLVIGGGNLSTNTVLGFGFTEAGTGTYTIGPSSPATNSAQFGTGPATNSWAAAYFEGNGTITLNTLTSTRVAGTFAFNMVPGPVGTGTGTKAITDGVFDITYTPTP